MTSSALLKLILAVFFCIFSGTVAVRVSVTGDSFLSRLQLHEQQDHAPAWNHGRTLNGKSGSEAFIRGREIEAIMWR